MLNGRRFLAGLLTLVFAVGAGGYVYRRTLLNASQPTVVGLFHHIYYNSGVAAHDTKWMGHEVQKTVADLWSFQEILAETQPDVLIETGTYLGGSTLYFANMMDVLGKGRIISIDIKREGPVPEHPRIEYVLASSVEPYTIERIRNAIKPGEKVMVTLDSSHAREHVAKELELYSPLVSEGCYLVVEDTNLNSVIPFRWGEGPLDAVDAFLAKHHEFHVDKRRERFFLTYNPSGFLLRDGAGS